MAREGRRRPPPRPSEGPHRGASGGSKGPTGSRLRLASYGVALDGENLLLCRLARRSSDPGMWTLPGGGRELGETPEDTLVREFREETGLAVEPVRLLRTECRVFSVARGDRSDGEALRFFYTVRVLGGTLTNELNESTDRAEWIPFDRLERLPVADVVEIALALLTG